MRKIHLCFISALALMCSSALSADACTGIGLKAKDGSTVVARTVEWLKDPMNCGYAVVPRGYKQISLTPQGENGLAFKARYGYVGIYTEYEKFVVEGVNEAGLSAGLFFFPGFGEYPDFVEARKSESLCDMQLVSWVLSTCSTIDEVKEAIKSVRIISLDPRVGTVHWRFSQPDGRVVVLEFKGGEPIFFENPLGTLTNSPSFDFHLTNLRNYVNLVPGAADNQTLIIGNSSPSDKRADIFGGAQYMGDAGFELSPLGGNSAMLGLPGDFTPPSRFVRAALFSASAPEWDSAFETVTQAFHILNNFDIPIGAQHREGMAPANLPSATQFTSATDLSSLKLYYRTAWNQNIRCIDLKTIDFSKVKYRTAPLDNSKVQPVEMVSVEG